MYGNDLLINSPGISWSTDPQSLRQQIKGHMETLKGCIIFLKKQQPGTITNSEIPLLGSGVISVVQVTECYNSITTLVSSILDTNSELGRSLKNTLPPVNLRQVLAQHSKKISDLQRTLFAYPHPRANVIFKNAFCVAFFGGLLMIAYYLTSWVFPPQSLRRSEQKYMGLIVLCILACGITGSISSCVSKSNSCLFNCLGSDPVKWEIQNFPQIKLKNMLQGLSRDDLSRVLWRMKAMKFMRELDNTSKSKQLDFNDYAACLETLESCQKWFKEMLKVLENPNYKFPSTGRITEV